LHLQKTQKSADGSAESSTVAREISGQQAKGEEMPVSNGGRCAVSVEVINPFIHSTVNALETMAFVKPVIGKPHLKADQSPVCDVSGSIGISGETTGTINVNFGRVSICSIVSNMLGETHEKIDETVTDAVGEIANMIAGGAKGEMQAKGMNFTIALPNVTVGAGHEHAFPHDVTTIVIPFTTDQGEFTVEVCLKTE
jgi:chemotaxis protein CheX